jgi:peroxiredoxin
MKLPYLIIATALTIAFIVRPSAIDAEVVKARLRKPAPGFTLTDAKRAPVTLSDFKGRVVILDFWTTWSPGCKIEMPWYAEFESKFRNNGLSAIGVSMDEEGWAIVTPYLEAHPITYPIVIGDHDVAERYDVASLPVTLLIDRNGKIASKHFGVVDKAGFENEIRKLLKEHPKKKK